MRTYRAFDETTPDETRYLILYGNWGYGSISLSLADEVGAFSDAAIRDRVCALLNHVIATADGDRPAPHLDDRWRATH